MTYHISVSGEPALCTASIRSCPRGGEESHYPDSESAQKAYELSNAHRATSLSKKNKAEGDGNKQTTLNAKTLEKVLDDNPHSVPTLDGMFQKRDYVPHLGRGKEVLSSDGTLAYFTENTVTTVEQWKHKQGKLVTVINREEMIVSKNGKIASTSGTISDLRRGRRGWERVSHPNINTVPGNGPNYSENSPKTHEKPAKDSQKRVPGYPKSSQIVSEAVVPENERRDPKHAPNYYGSDRRPVLYTQTNVNPHNFPENNEFIKGWGDGSVLSVIRNDESGKPSYRILVSGHNGKTDDHVGDTFPLQHDQTQARLKDSSWKVVGLFEPKPGGKSEGEIPNRNMRMYVYK